MYCVCHPVVVRYSTTKDDLLKLMCVLVELSLSINTSVVSVYDLYCTYIDMLMSGFGSPRMAWGALRVRNIGHTYDKTITKCQVTSTST